MSRRSVGGGLMSYIDGARILLLIHMDYGSSYVRAIIASGTGPDELEYQHLAVGGRMTSGRGRGARDHRRGLGINRLSYSRWYQTRFLQPLITAMAVMRVYVGQTTKKRCHLRIVGIMT